MLSIQKDFAIEVFSKYTEEKTDSIYYHVTECQNVESIMKTGLKRPSERKSIFFAASVDDCLQLAPASGGFYWLKAYMDNMQIRNAETITFKLAALSVDLQGLTEKLFRRANFKVKDLAERKGGRLIYEYLLDRDVEPERIINVENLELSMAVPVCTKEYFEKMFQIV